MPASDLHITHPCRRPGKSRIRRAALAGICAASTILGAVRDGSHAHAAPRYCPPGQNYAPYYAPCPPGAEKAATPETTPEGETPESSQAEQTPETAPPAQTAAPQSSSASGATGSTSSPLSSVPNAIGDFFGIAQPGHITLAPSSHYFYNDNYLDSYLSSYVNNGGLHYLEVPDPGASVVGRVKASENNSPIPQDRYFLDFAHYQNTPLGGANVGVTRLTPGIERTTLDGAVSVEIRMPMAQTLDDRFTVGGATDGDSWQPGNLYTAVKGLLYADDNLAVATGMGISTPTASDIKFAVAGVGVVAEAQNHAVHLLPYVASLYTPNDTFFTQAYLQVDVDANGNPILVNGNRAGVFQAQSLMYVDGILGAWLYDDPYSDGLTSIAGVTELHYTTSVSDPDIVGVSNDLVVTSGDKDINILTGIVGVHFLYAGGARVTFGYGVPLTSDRFADGEFRMLLNFGPPFGGLAGR